MIDEILEILSEVEHKQDSFLTKEYSIDYDKAEDYLNNILKYPEHFLVLQLGKSFLIATCVEYDFSYDKVANIPHIVSLDNNGKVLLSLAEQWATEKGAKFITDVTNYSVRTGYIKLYEKRGYDHIGYSFKKDL